MFFNCHHIASGDFYTRWKQVNNFPEADFLDNLRGGRLAGRLLLRITYGMAI